MQTTKHAEIDSAIAQVAAGLTQLRGLMQDPSDLSFELLHPHFEHLERALGNKAAIDAAFAFIAERDDAGRHVGSSKAKDYLTARLGLSESEAAARLSNERTLRFACATRGEKAVAWDVVRIIHTLQKSVA